MALSVRFTLTTSKLDATIFWLFLSRISTKSKSFKLDLAIGDSRLNVDPLNVDTKYLAELL